MSNSESLFNTVPVCNDPECDGSVFDMDFCTCETSGGVLNVNCGQNIAQPQMAPENPPFTLVPNTKVNGGTRKRGTVYSDDVIYLYDNIEPDVSILPSRKRRNVNIKMSLKNATDYCENYLINTNAARVCLEISNVNVSSAIGQCAADLQVSYSAITLFLILDKYFKVLVICVVFVKVIINIITRSVKTSGVTQHGDQR